MNWETCRVGGCFSASLPLFLLQVHGDSIAAMSGILKRKFEEVDGSSPCSSVRESDDDISSSESADSGDSVNPSTSNHFTREY